MWGGKNDTLSNNATDISTTDTSTTSDGNSNSSSTKGKGKNRNKNKNKKKKTNINSNEATGGEQLETDIDHWVEVIKLHISYATAVMQ